MGHLGRVDDGAVQPALDGHGQEDTVDRLPVGQAKGDIAGAQRHIDPQFLLDHADRLQRDPPRLAVGAHRQRQAVDEDVLAANAVLLRAVDDLFGNSQPLLRCIGDAIIVHAQTDDRRAILGHQGQDAGQARFFAVDRVNQRLSVGIQFLVQGQCCGKCLAVGCVNADGYIHRLHHQLHSLWQQVHLINAGRADVHIQEVSPGLHLAEGFLADHFQVASQQGRSQFLLACWIDPLTQDHGWTTVTNDKLLAHSL